MASDLSPSCSRKRTPWTVQHVEIRVKQWLQQECLRLQRRLQPFRRTQLRWRGRLKQSMQEHEAILLALENGNASQAAGAIRSHVAVQGEKFHHLMASLKTAAE